MPSVKTLWRHANPEKYEEEKKRDRIRLKAYYANSPERREAVKKSATERYQRLKAEKAELNSVEEFLKNFH